MSVLNEKSTTKPILWIGFFVGAMASWGLLSGDQQGHVNILFLLLIYVALPILSLSISCLSLIFGGGLNLAKLTSVLPFWSKPIQLAFLRQKQTPHSKFYFFYQSQLAALSFSLASIVIFFMLLLTTDVNFIWRSTILTAQDIHPLLNTIAWPWQFWSAAQPDLNLLILTQDSRLANSNTHFGQLGNWWRFILATQLFYALLLRGSAIVACKIVLLINQHKQIDIQLVTDRQSNNTITESHELATAVADTHSDFALTNWGGIEQSYVDSVLSRLSYHQVTELKAGPLVSEAEQLVAERWQEPQLLLVKGWEPPLGELRDYMQNGNGYLMPLDWSNNKLVPLSKTHLVEWRRFAKPLESWQVLQLGD